ncbi:MAG TPA: hypothetical protein VGK35_10560 [Actinotalea sp.]|jgi:hypothetical protein
MSTLEMDTAPVEVDTTSTPSVVPVPCAARPSTAFVHLDGPCRCFFGGPAPEFTAPPSAHFWHAS